jgi:hypothetical protein
MLLTIFLVIATKSDIIFGFLTIFIIYQRKKAVDMDLNPMNTIAIFKNHFSLYRFGVSQTDNQ